jgi:hypothetical protein
VPETFSETPADALARTTLTDRELLIHALQHLEVMYEQQAEMHSAVMRIDGQLSMFAPLLAKWAPGGKPDMLALMQARREAKRGQL